MSSNRLSNRLSLHCEILSRYTSFGIDRLFLKITKASWACRCFWRSTALVKSSILSSMALSCMCFAFKDGSPQKSHVDVALVDTDKIIERGECADFCEIVCDDFTFVHVIIIIVIIINFLAMRSVIRSNNAVG